MKESGDLRKAGLVRARSPYNIIHQCFTFKNVSKLSKLHMIKYGGNIYKRDSLKFEKERMKIYTKGSRGKKQTGTRKTTKQRKKQEQGKTEKEESYMYIGENGIWCKEKEK